MNIAVESDCNKVISDRFESNKYPCAAAKKIKKLMPCFNSIEFVHVYRVADNAAHILAKFSSTPKDETCFNCARQCVQARILSL